MFRRKPKQNKPGPKRDAEKVRAEQVEIQADTVLDSLVFALREQGEDERGIAAILLAEGYTVAVTAKAVGVAERTLYYWRNDAEFMQFVDELTLTHGVATKAERVRAGKRILRAVENYRVTHDKAPSDKDPLDWLKYLRDEMEGFRLLDDDTLEKLAEVLAGNQREESADGGSGGAGGEDCGEAGGSADQE